MIKLAMAGLLGGCSPLRRMTIEPVGDATGTPAAMPTATTAATRTPVPAETPVPTETPAPAATPAALPNSRVAESCGAAWRDGVLAPDAVRTILRASITAMTGLNDAGAAWASLFAPHERIAIKVNAFMAGAETSLPLVTAVYKFARILEAEGQDSASCVKLASDWLSKSAGLGLGNDQMDHIKWVTVEID